IPQIAPVATDPMLVNPQTYPFLVRLSATDTVQSRVIADVIDHFGWQQMSILTSSDDYGTHGFIEFERIAGVKGWLASTHGFIEFERIAGVKGWLIRTVQSFDPTEDPRRIRVRRQLQAIKAAVVAMPLPFDPKASCVLSALLCPDLCAYPGSGIVTALRLLGGDPSRARIVLLNCLASFGLEVLRQAGDMGLTGVGWAWIVTDGVTGMTSFRKNETVPRHLLGLLGVKPVEDKGELFGDFMKLWSAADSTRYPGAGIWDIEAYPAKFVDAVLLFAFAYRDLLRDGQTMTGAAVQCDQFPPQTWPYGNAMLQYLRKSTEEDQSDWSKALGERTFCVGSDLLRDGQTMTGAAVQCDQFPPQTWPYGNAMLQYLRKWLGFGALTAKARVGYNCKKQEERVEADKPTGPGPGFEPTISRGPASNPRLLPNRLKDLDPSAQAISSRHPNTLHVKNYDHVLLMSFPGTTLCQMVSEEGISSKILFTKDGTPSQVEFDIVNLHRNGWQRDIHVAGPTARAKPSSPSPHAVPSCLPCNTRLCMMYKMTNKVVDVPTTNRLPPRRVPAKLVRYAEGWLYRLYRCSSCQTSITITMPSPLTSLPRLIHCSRTRHDNKTYRFLPRESP
ncbi:hypothetical protein Bbelb_223750, partial [Branchiostoma belcheri]